VLQSESPSLRINPDSQSTRRKNLVDEKPISVGNVSLDIDAVAMKIQQHSLHWSQLASTSHVCVLPSYRRLEQATKPLVTEIK